MRGKVIIQNLSVCILLLLSSIFAIINSVKYPFYILTVVYFIVSNLCKNNLRALGKFPGRTVINLILFIRYCFVPFVLCMDGSLSVYANNYDYMNEAILLMIYELVVVFLALELSALKKKNKSLLRDTQEVKIFRVGRISVVLIVVALIVILWISKGALLNFSLLNGDNASSKSSGDVSNLMMVIWEVLLVLLLVVIINYSKRKYDKDKSRRHVMWSVGVGIVYIALVFFAQSRISRWYFLISAISVMCVLCRFYPKEKKLIMFELLIPVLLVLILATALKNGDSSENSILSKIESILNATTFDIYFAGPVSVNNAIGLIQNSDVSIRSFIFDVLNNFPIVNRYIDSKNSSVYLYNLYIGRIFGSGSSGDQIIPLLGQSSIYFSYILAPLLSVVSVIVISCCDRMFYCSSGSKCYICVFTSAWVGVATVLNMTVILSWVYSRILPMLVVFSLFEFLNRRRLGNRQPEPIL